MSAPALALAPSAVRASGRPGDRRSAGVRLLLPPVIDPEPDPVPHAAREVALRLISVRSPLDEAAGVAHDGTAGQEETPALPDPRGVAGPLVVAAHEALTGSRPLAQLTRWVCPELYARLADALPLTRTTSPRRRTRIISVRADQPQPDVAEATVVLHDGVRVRAAAVRLEEHRGRWRATVLDIG